MADDKDALMALEAFVGNDGKEERIFRQGDPVRPSDPAVKKWPHLFGPAKFYNGPRAEHANPGDKREL